MAVCSLVPEGRERNDKISITRNQQQRGRRISSQMTCNLIGKKQSGELAKALTTLLPDNYLGLN